jgi:hypothetical protein
VFVSLLLSAALAGSYLAAGGASYAPAEVKDPCDPRPWRDPGNLQEAAEQFSLSALDGAACELGVSREVVAQALASPDARAEFADRYDVDDAELEAAVRAGLLRGINDAEAAGALSPVLAGPLRQLTQSVPLEQAIRLIQDAGPLFDSAQGILNGVPGLSGLLDQAQGFLPPEARGFLP